MGLLDDVLNTPEPPKEPEKPKANPVVEAARNAFTKTERQPGAGPTRVSKIAADAGIDPEAAKRELVLNPTADGVRIGQPWCLPSEQRPFPFGRWTVTDVLTQPRRVVLMSNDTGQRKTLPLDRFVSEYVHG